MNPIKISGFKAYDLRGRIPSELNEDVAYRVGRAYAEFVKPKKVIVGRDIRHHTDFLATLLRDFHLAVLAAATVAMFAALPAALALVLNAFVWGVAWWPFRQLEGGLLSDAIGSASDEDCGRGHRGREGDRRKEIGVRR